MSNSSGSESKALSVKQRLESHIGWVCISALCTGIALGLAIAKSRDLNDHDRPAAAESDKKYKNPTRYLQVSTTPKDAMGGSNCIDCYLEIKRVNGGMIEVINNMAGLSGHAAKVENSNLWVGEMSSTNEGWRQVKIAKVLSYGVEGAVVSFAPTNGWAPWTARYIATD